jgi:hypothetical protein
MTHSAANETEEEGIERFMKQVDGYAGLWAAKHSGLLDSKTAKHALSESRDKLKKALRGILKANRLTPDQEKHEPT